MSDIWHYARSDLAKQILGNFEINLSSALVFFAPRRKGKTEFLNKDIKPLAKSKGWKVFYFSFLDRDTGNTHLGFIKALLNFDESLNKLKKIKAWLEKINQVSGEIGGFKASIDLGKKEIQDNMREVMSHLAKKEKVLLLLDEVQVLAQDKENSSFIAALRTALDLHKDSIKVIFTGSSQEGLRQMFAQSKAPFFHFGQNLPFPDLDRGFVDHLVKVFQKATKRVLNADALWEIFEKTHKLPQFLRTLLERLALNPHFELKSTYQALRSEVFEDPMFESKWKQCSALEQILLKSILENNTALFSEASRKQFAKALGLKTLSASAIQTALLSLQRKELVFRLSERAGYAIEELHFKEWLQNNH